MMAGLFLGTVSLMYAIAAVNYLITGNKGMAIAFFAYAIANYGLWLSGH